MGFWSKVLGDKSRTAPVGSDTAPSLTAPTPGVPTSVAAIPGKLEVVFYAHDSLEGAPGNFLTAVTSGYRKHGQGELVLSLRLAETDDVPSRMAEIRRFFAAIYAWARQGQLTTAGGLTQFGDRGLFGRSGSGILYADARPIEGVQIPGGALVAILVDAAEVRTASDYGVYRVLSRIGESHRQFPFPLWSDLDRKSVVGDREGETRLAKIARMRTPGVSFLMEDERVRVQLSPSMRATVGRGVASLAPNTAFALLVNPAKGANALLVWHPGQKEPAAISPDGSDGSRTSGSCLLVVPGQRENRGRMVEDGYSLLLSAESWAAIAAALAQQRPISLRLEDGVTLSFQWQSEAPDDAAARFV